MERSHSIAEDGEAATSIVSSAAAAVSRRLNAADVADKSALACGRILIDGAYGCRKLPTVAGHKQKPPVDCPFYGSIRRHVRWRQRLIDQLAFGVRSRIPLV